VAGVAPEDVLVDRTNKRAQVRAAPLPGADLASYRALEARVAAAEQGWTLILVPPAAPLPNVDFEEGEPSEAGARALATAAWAAQRLNLPVGVAGDDAEAVTEALEAQGVTVRPLASDGDSGARLSWVAPVAEAQE
jgi:hypothetical protein